MITIKKTCVFRSDLLRDYTEQYLQEYNKLLHFSSLKHDLKYKEVWKNIPQSTKDDYLNYFIGKNNKDENLKELLKLYLQDQNLNNIRTTKFDILNKYVLINLFNLKSYGLYMNCCYFKGMLREFLNTFNTEELKIVVYCVEDLSLNRYIFATDDILQLKPYTDKTKFQIWEENK